MVGGRPTLRCRSEPLRCTISEMACLKLNGGLKLPRARSAQPLGSTRKSTVPNSTGCASSTSTSRTTPGDLGLDLVHDLHRFDDADRLPGGHPAADLHVRLRARLGRPVEGAHHRRLDVLERGRRRRRGSRRALADAGAAGAGIAA